MKGEDVLATVALVVSVAVSTAVLSPIFCVGRSGLDIRPNDSKAQSATWTFYPCENGRDGRCYTLVVE